MSLLRQLWIVALAACALAFAGSFAVSLITARSYLQQQLLAQATDGAAALALSMSQQAKDEATAELMVSALFDSGHYARIRYEDARGKTVAERVSETSASDAPAWFTGLLRLDPQPGTALVNRGWNQAGRVTLVPQVRFAYEALWQGALQLCVVMAGLALILGLSLSVLVRWLRGPLNEMVAQAEAIGERRFVTMREPKVRELRSAVRALNLMVDRVRVMFGEQAARIEDLRTEANRDPLTSLPNRGFFLGRLRSELQDEDAAPTGALALVRIAGLADLNRRLGRERTDALLRSTADVLREVADGEAEHFLARLNGADFAWLMPGADPDTASRLAASAARALEALHRHGHADRSPVGFVGVALFHRGDELGHVMARADAALMRAERGEDAEPVISAYDTPLVARTQEEWRSLLQAALAARDFALAGFPVAHIDGRAWHEEAMMRMRAPDDGAPWTAGQFMPAADRLGMTVALDLLAVELALQRLHHVTGPIAVNLSPISLTDLQFREGLQRRLAASPAMARRLWVEVSERGLDQGLSGLAAVAPILSQHGCKLGIEHFGRHFSAIPRLYAQRVDYLKVDGSFVAGIEENAGNQRLIKAIVDVARGLDIQVLAERVSTTAEWQTLAELGVAGVTGPAVTERLRPS
ncbi:EAL domain-containing protein [Niveibacterium sp. SC-1]|uniref:bifunctional diguanylate cyclase/phosphodiesterase n=1 Tax=Niveibacterium sp. SC-1 TaxID=3135646 RepID=UPI00311FDF7F